MRIAPVLFASAAIAGAALPALGQFVPPVPGRTAPTPEYTPPAPPPIPPPGAEAPPANPPAPPAPEKPLPSLIERDEQGHLKPLSLPLNEAAVRALEMDDAGKARLEGALAERAKEMDRIVVHNLPQLMEVRTLIANVGEKPDIDALRERTTAVRTTFQKTPMLDALARAGAITPVQKTQAGKIARDYAVAMQADLRDRYGKDNLMAAVPVIARNSLQEYAAEAWQSLDRQLAAAAPRQEELLKGLDLPAPARADVNKRLGALKGKPPEGKTASEHRVEVLRGIFFEALSNDQRKALLIAANPDLATPPAAEEKPATAPAAPPAPPAAPPPGKK